ncbi:RNA polymerase II transcription factor B 52 kDa subunit [Saitoella coloradoensis]
MSTLYNDAPVQAADIDAWVEPGSKGRQKNAMEKLKRMHVYKEYKGEVTMNPAFRTNFRIALTGGGDHKSLGVPCSTDDKNAVTVDFLDNHATEQWEMILRFMVNTPMDKMPGDGVVSLLQKSGLMEGNPQRRETMSITNAGFQFLLQDVNAQVWALLLQYLTVAEELEMDPVEVLHFLFMLG